MLQDILDGKIYNLLQYLKYFIRYCGFHDLIHPNTYRETLRCQLLENWYLYNSSTKLDDIIFTCTVSCIDSKNITIIIVWPVSSAELNVQSAFIFSLYHNYSIFSDQYNPYLPAIKHLYFICILSMWLVIAWWSLPRSLIHICQMLAVKVDPISNRGPKNKNFPRKAIKILFYYWIFW